MEEPGQGRVARRMWHVPVVIQGCLPVLASIRQCDAPLDARRRSCGVLATPGCASGHAHSPEYEQIIHEVDGVLGDLGAGNYTDARGRLCQEYSVDTLREEFDPYAKPWRYEITGSEYTTQANGLVNVLLTAADKQEQAYTFDVAYRERRWQVCRYLKGNYGSVG